MGTRHSLRSRRRVAARRLAGFYRRNGYVRLQDPERVEREGWGRYKKGDEVRLVAASLQELELIRRLLLEAGFKPGSPFVKGRQHRQPIYGREAVVRFLEMVDAETDV